MLQDVCRWQHKCCWKPAADPKAPACFFPRNWGYEVSNVRTNTSTGKPCPDTVPGSHCASAKIAAKWKLILSLVLILLP